MNIFLFFFFVRCRLLVGRTPLNAVLLLSEMCLLKSFLLFQAFLQSSMMFDLTTEWKKGIASYTILSYVIFLSPKIPTRCLSFPACLILLLLYLVIISYSRGEGAFCFTSFIPVRHRTRKRRFRGAERLQNYILF